MITKLQIINIIFIFMICIHVNLADKSNGFLIMRADMRTVHQNDMGFYFDVTVMNNLQPKEMLPFTIHSDRCCLKISKDDVNCQISRLIGGDFDQIAAGTSTIVTLIWPTITLYNRIGYCDINLLSTRSNGNKIKINHRIKFNTTVTLNSEITTDIMSEFIKRANITECSTNDLNPFDDCSPVNCEEKYFGNRNFFNTYENLCQSVPDCGSNRNMIYDVYNNTCFNFNDVFTDESFTRLKNGEFDDNIWIGNNEEKKIYSDLDETPFEINNAKPYQNWDTTLYIMMMVLIGLTVYFGVAGISFLLIFCDFGGRQRRKKKMNEKFTKIIYDKEINPFTID